MKIVSILFLMTLSLLGANKAMVNLSDLDAEVELDIDFSTLFENFGEDAYFFGGGMLFTDDGDGPMVYFGKIYYESKVQGNEAMTLALGLKPIYFTSQSRTFMSVPFGAEISYILSADDQTAILFLASFYRANERVSSRDALGYAEYRSGFALEAADGIVFIEYRSMVAKYETGKETLNKTFFAGLKMSF